MNGPEFAARAVRRTGGRLLRRTVGFALVGLLLFAGLTGLGWLAFQTGSVGSGPCVGSATGPLPPANALTPPVTDEQRTNAAIIIQTGRSLGVPDRGLWVALATAMQESGLRNLTYGDRDSLGLFQQRPSQGWGTPAQINDPQYAATQFFTRLLAVPDWASMPLAQAAQTVQRSAFPSAYAKWEVLAAKLLADLGQTVLAGIGAVCQLVAPVAFTGTDAGCVADDPTTGGCLTTATSHALNAVGQAFGGYRGGPVIRSTACFSQRPASQKSDHPLGRACDFFPGTAGEFAQGKDVDAGWQVANWFRTYAEELQVSYVIWQGRIWGLNSHDQNGWGRKYTGGGIHDADDATGGHYDHLHVSFRR